MWDRKELKQRGKAAFKANYWKCVLVALLLTLFAAGASTSASRTASTTLNENNYSISLAGQGTEVVVNDQTFENAGDAITAIGTAEGADAQVVADLAEAASTIQSNPEAQKAVGIMLAALGGAILVIGIVGAILRLLVFNPLQAGCRGFFTRNSEAPAEVSEIKAGFHPYGRTVGAMFLRDLFIFLWSLLFVIPGLIKIYSYRMVPYILADDPTIGGKDAITLSRQMMNGHKWNAFVLDLSFIGWELLSVLTAGLLGLFYVKPYEAATGAELYKVLKNQ